MKPLLLQLLPLVGILLGMATHSAANRLPSYLRRVLAPGLSVTAADGNGTITFYNIITLPPHVEGAVGVTYTLGAGQGFFAQALAAPWPGPGERPAGRLAKWAR